MTGHLGTGHLGTGQLGSAGTIALVQTPSPPPSAPGGQGEDFGKSSPIGLVVILLFFVAVAFLVRSMTKHLRRIPPSFDPPEQRRDRPGDEGPGHEGLGGEGPGGEDPGAPGSDVPSRGRDPEGRQ